MQEDLALLHLGYSLLFFLIVFFLRMALNVCWLYRISVPEVQTMVSSLVELGSMKLIVNCGVSGHLGQADSISGWCISDFLGLGFNVFI